jgi:hypothetical protein
MYRPTLTLKNFIFYSFPKLNFLVNICNEDTGYFTWGKGKSKAIAVTGRGGL